ncbi:MAG: ATP-grasp domain-containing protein [Pseudomonadota bacterium]
MDFEEYKGKALLREFGIATPKSFLVESAKMTSEKAQHLLNGAVIKAQVPTGKRGLAGGIKLIKTPGEAYSVAQQILGMQIGDRKVEKLLVEEQIPILAECYGAIISDYAGKSPSLLFSLKGGMEVEELAKKNPNLMNKFTISIEQGLSQSQIEAYVKQLDWDAFLKANRKKLEGYHFDLDPLQKKLMEHFLKLYQIWRTHDLELLEINPLVLTLKGDVIALDCKMTLDDGACNRQSDLAQKAALPAATPLEAKARDLGLKYIELDGNVGILANGAGLTMTSMDMIAYYGGKPANFMEIGGQAYTQGADALKIVLANKNVKSVLVNLCGAFARTDVMVEGIIEALEELDSDVPFFFSVHGTGDREAIDLLRQRLGVEPFSSGDEAAKAAIKVANA